MAPVGPGWAAAAVKASLCLLAVAVAMAQGIHAVAEVAAAALAKEATALG